MVKLYGNCNISREKASSQEHTRGRLHFLRNATRSLEYSKSWCGRTGASGFPKGESNDIVKALGPSGMKSAPPGTWQGAPGNPSEQSVGCARYRPGGLEAKPTGRFAALPSSVGRCNYGVFISRGCWNKIPQTAWLKQHTCLSLSSGGWEVQDQSASRLDSWRGPPSQLADGHLRAVSSHGRGRKLWSLVFFL